MAEEQKDLSLVPAGNSAPCFFVPIPTRTVKSWSPVQLKDILIGLVITDKKPLRTSRPAHQLQERRPLVGRLLGQQVLDILPADHPGLGDQPADGVKHKGSRRRPVRAPR